MTATQLAGSEIVKLGKKIYQEIICAQVEPGNIGKFVAIDVSSGDFEMAPDELSAADRLLARKANAILYLHRIGYSAAVDLGGSISSIDPL